jgi:hypothetical protein
VERVSGVRAAEGTVLVGLEVTLATEDDGRGDARLVGEIRAAGTFYDPGVVIATAFEDPGGQRVLEFAQNGALVHTVSFDDFREALVMISKRFGW